MLTVMPTLTLLTLLYPTNPNCTRKTWNSPPFDEQSHKTISTMPYLWMHWIMGCY